MKELLYQAAAAKHGIVVRTNDANLLRQRLYAARRTGEPDPALDRLILSPSRENPNTELWIINPPQDTERPGAEEVIHSSRDGVDPSL